MSTPIELIEQGQLHGMLAEINVLRAAIDNECSEIAELWDGLGRAGGQRADHAAALLARLRPALGAMENFCGRCLIQINEHVADPFGRKDA
jgi:hypothetical protein